MCVLLLIVARAGERGEGGASVKRTIYLLFFFSFFSFFFAFFFPPFFSVGDLRALLEIIDNTCALILHFLSQHI